MTNKIKLTKNNFLNFLETAFSAASLKNLSVDQQIEFADTVGKQLEAAFDLRGLTGEDLVLAYFDSSLADYDWVFAPEDSSGAEQSEARLEIYVDPKVKKEFSKHADVLQNLDTIVADLRSVPQDIVQNLLKTLQQSNGDFRLGKGVLCSPRKYLGQSGLTIKAGYSPLEIRINSKDSAQYRVYGIFKANKFYLLVGHIKNSGQANANQYFDFLVKNVLNPYITNVLHENLSYNNIDKLKLKESSYTMSEAFEDLNTIYNKAADNSEVAGVQDYLDGITAGRNGTILEVTATEAFKAGYKRGQWLENSRIMQENIEVIKAKIEAKIKAKTVSKN